MDEKTNNRQIWVRVEIDWLIYINYVGVNTSKFDVNARVFTNEELNTIFPEEDFAVEGCFTDWTILFELLGVEDAETEDTPDFQGMNDIYYKLFDENFFDKYVDIVIDVIKDYMDQEPPVAV